MQVLRGTIREVVALLPDDARIELAVPVRYQAGQLEAIFDVVVVIPEPKVETPPELRSTATNPSPRSRSSARPAARTTAK